MLITDFFLGGLSNYIPKTSYLLSRTTGVGAVAGTVSLVVSSFFGYDSLYPAAVTGLCFCAWVGTKLSQASSQQEIFDHEIRGKLIQDVKKHLDKTLLRTNSFLGSLSNNKPEIAFFFSRATGVVAVAGTVSLAVSLLFGYNSLYPAAVTGFCFCAWTGTNLSKTPQQEAFDQEFRKKLLHDVKQYLDRTFVNHDIRCLIKFLFSTPAPIWEESKFWTGHDLWEDRKGWKELKQWPAIANSHLTNDSSFWESLVPSCNFVKVRVLTDGTDLKYEMIKSKTGIKKTGDIKSYQSTEETIEFLKGCFVALEDDDETPVFSLAYHTWEYGSSHTVRLLRGNHNLIWNIDHNRRSISTKRISLSSRCTKEAHQYFESIKKCSLDTSIQLAKAFKLYYCGSSSVCLEPIYGACYLNEDELVSTCMWAVTLVRYMGISGNHAEIIIEGYNDGFFSEQDVPIGKYFMFLTDLYGEMKVPENQATADDKKTWWTKVCKLVKDKLFKPETVRYIRTNFIDKSTLRYEARSPTWKRSSKLVQEMIKDIIHEKKHPPSGFSRLGRHSIFASENQESCITWALSKLAMIDVIFQKPTYAFIFTNTSLFTKFNPDENDPRPETNWVFWYDKSKLI